MEVCGEAENRLASELMQHELQIEKDVLDPLSQLAEVRALGSAGHQLRYFKTFSYLLRLFKNSSRKTPFCFALFGLNRSGKDELTVCLLCTA